MTADEVGAALAELSAAIADGELSVVPVPVEAFRAAEDIASRVADPVRAMDALHLAMASMLHAELATFDAAQAMAARASGITTHTETD